MLPVKSLKTSSAVVRAGYIDISVTIKKTHRYATASYLPPWGAEEVVWTIKSVVKQGTQRLGMSVNTHERKHVLILASPLAADTIPSSFNSGNTFTDVPDKLAITSHVPLV